MGKPRGSIGETKLKILATLHKNEDVGNASYGYGVWKTMKEKYCSCLGDDGLRNVYHHLQDLQDLGFITRSSNQSANGAPERRPYSLTGKGRSLYEKYEKYLVL